MPKIYRRKSNRGNWSVESMMLAAKAVEEGRMSLFKASKEFGVPRNTLRDRVKGNSTKKPYEKESVLGVKNENALVERLIRLQRMGFGLTITDVRRMAYEFVEKNHLPNNLFSEDKRMAGWDWYYAFLKRNSQISLRQAQSISHARAECMNRPVISSFFDMYEKEIDVLSMRNSPQSIYNADETGMQLHLRPGKVLAAKGDRSVLQITNAERGENVTVMACCSAAGHFIPPMVIFKGQRCKEEFSDGMPPGTLVKLSESGYISTELFLIWLKHFQVHRTPGKAVLILDGHASHVKSIEVLDYAVANDITMICLPPHSTHFMQPLDRSFFRPLKIYYDQSCKTFLSNHPGRAITKLQFGALLNRAWGKAASTENAVNGFRVCGLFPVDRSAIPDYAYAPSLASDMGPLNCSNEQPVDQAVSISQGVQTGHSKSTSAPTKSNANPAQPADPLVLPDDPTASTSFPVASTSTAVASTSTAVASTSTPVASTSTPVASTSTPVESTSTPVASTSTPVASISTPVASTSTPVASTSTPVASTSLLSVSFNDLHPTPKINRARKSNGGRRQSAAVLTSPAYRKNLFEKNESKKKRTPSNESKKKRTSTKTVLNKEKPCSKEKPQQGKLKNKIQQSQKKQSGTLRVKNVRASNTCRNNYCAECNGWYYDDNQNSDEEWISCQNCSAWYHESCADAINDLYFTCKICKSKR